MRPPRAARRFSAALSTALLLLNVAASGPAVAATTYGLVVQRIPGPAYAGRPFEIDLAVIDFGTSPATVVTSGTSATVTLALSSSPTTGGVLSCEGGLTKPIETTGTAAGSVTFGGCTIDRSGTGFQLTATASSVVSTIVPPPTIKPVQFTIDVAPETEAPQPSIHVSVTHDGSVPYFTWGQTVTVRVVFSENGADRPFQLQQTTRTMQTWVGLADLVTDAHGVATFSYRPSVSTRFRVVYAGSVDLDAGASASTGFLLFSLAKQVPANAVPRVVRRGTSLTFATTVRPILPDLAPARVYFQIYHRVSGAWKLASWRFVTVDSSGVARMTLKFGSRGEWYVRSSAQARWVGDPETAPAVAWASRPTPIARVSVR
jgi:hypothetical protein